MSKNVLGHRRRTHPLIWCAAVICTVLAVAVVITGLVVFVGYLIIRPKVPFVSVTNAGLDNLSYDQSGQLTAALTIVIRADNHNRRGHANFYDAGFGLYFHGLQIAKLVAEPFSVRKNSSVEFHYQVESSPIPLDAAAMDYVDAALKENKIAFNMKGHVRTRWRVGILGSVKFWCDLDCQLQFNPLNRSYIPSYCSSKSK